MLDKLKTLNIKQQTLSSLPFYIWRIIYLARQNAGKRSNTALGQNIQIAAARRQATPGRLY
jgi:hypothetical protein